MEAKPNDGGGVLLPISFADAVEGAAWLELFEEVVDLHMER
jgi:hypothetical protein